MRKSLIFFLLCFIGALLNAGACELMSRMGIPLYMDTVFTIAFTLAGGLFPGIICGALTNIIICSAYFVGWPHYLFIICSITTALITALFVRFFPRELNLSAKSSRTAAAAGTSRTLSVIMDRLIVFILLSFALCAAMSVLGGTIATAIKVLVHAGAERQNAAPESALLAASMFSRNLPVLPREILSRVPVNIIDRLISVFAGYGIALALRAFMRRAKLNVTPAAVSRAEPETAILPQK